MGTFSKGQKAHISTTIRRHRQRLFGESGGNKRLAEEIGVSPQLVSLWAANKRTPSESQLYALAKVFHVNVHDFYANGKNSTGQSRKEHATATSSSQSSKPHKCPSLPAEKAAILYTFGIIKDLAAMEQSAILGELDHDEYMKSLERIDGILHRK